MLDKFLSLTRALAEAVRRQCEHAMTGILRVVAIVDLKEIVLALSSNCFHEKNDLREGNAGDAREREKNDEAQLRHDVSVRQPIGALD